MQREVFSIEAEFDSPVLSLPSMKSYLDASYGLNRFRPRLPAGHAIITKELLVQFLDLDLDPNFALIFTGLSGQ